MTAKEASYATAHYHTQSNGWPGHGYHFEIAPDGTVSHTGSVESIRANVWGLNHKVVGVALVGNLSAHQPTDNQLASLRWLRWNSGLIPPLENVGHMDIALLGHGTACPGDTFDDWRWALIAPNAN